MSNTSILLIFTFAGILLLGMFNSMKECESNGGRFMKNLNSTYECVYERSNK